MSDAFRTSVDKLKKSTAELNKTADNAFEAVKAVEEYLENECSVGIESWVEVSKEPINETGMEGQDEELVTLLGYQRWAGRYRIIVHVGIDHERCEVKPWSEWDRTTKLRTVQKLPDLIERIADDIDVIVSAAQGATSTVTDVLKTLYHKGGK